MTASSREERNALRDVVADLFGKELPPHRLRELWESDTGRSETLWGRLGEIGVTGLLIDDQHAGTGGTEEDAVVVLEEAGRFCVPDPLLESMFIATPLLAEGGSSAQRDEWLSQLAAGSAVATVSLGGARHVADAHLADVLILEVEGSLHLLTQDDFQATPVVSMDPSRRIFRVHARPSSKSLMPAGREVLHRASDRAALGSAALLNGISLHLLDTTVAYVKKREQFGRPIGSFQAVKHLLAEAYAAVSLSRQATISAAHAFAERSLNGSDACAAAKVCAVGSERRANDVALQCHGGIGYTWEYDLHMWLKRGKALELVHGTERALSNRLGATAIHGNS